MYFENNWTLLVVLIVQNFMGEPWTLALQIDPLHTAEQAKRLADNLG